MNKLKLYFDTSIISHLEQDDAPEKMAETCQLWEMVKAGKFDVVLSDVVTREIDDCDEKKREKLNDHLKEIKYDYIKVPEESIKIANKIIELGILKKKSFDDCRHIANAIISGCDAIVSWNFKHIVNPKTVKGIRAITVLEGHKDLLIFSPPSLLVEGEDDPL